ncbi:hypothetical protein GBA52_028765 [Prunus armeniaca]|nr:hypothetical protein GBA52_028765 [Prunus armeniaca]
MALLEKEKDALSIEANLFPPGFKIPPRTGEEGNSQPSQGVGQRLPGSPLEISSPGISGDPGSLPPSEAAPPANPGGSREAVPPANPAGSQEAGPSNQGPAPSLSVYQPDQVIGGDSVETIKRRLLSGHEADLRGLRRFSGKCHASTQKGLGWNAVLGRSITPGGESLERLFRDIGRTPGGRTPVGGVR